MFRLSKHLLCLLDLFVDSKLEVGLGDFQNTMRLYPIEKPSPQELFGKRVLSHALELRKCDVFWLLEGRAWWSQNDPFLEGRDGFLLLGYCFGYLGRRFKLPQFDRRQPDSRWTSMRSQPGGRIRVYLCLIQCLRNTWRPSYHFFPRQKVIFLLSRVFWLYVGFLNNLWQPDLFPKQRYRAATFRPFLLNHNFTFGLTLNILPGLCMLLREHLSGVIFFPKVFLAHPNRLFVRNKCLLELSQKFELHRTVEMRSRCHFHKKNWVCLPWQ